MITYIHTEVFAQLYLVNTNNVGTMCLYEINICLLNGCTRINLFVTGKLVWGVTE